MDFELTADQQAIVDHVATVLAKEWPDDVALRAADDASLAQGLWSTVTSLGWPATTIPVAHGGLGLGFAELSLVLHEVARRPVLLPLLSTTSQFVPAVLLGGDREQQGRWLRPVAEGTLVGTVALAGPGGSWRPDAVETVAHVVPGGYVLEGSTSAVLDGDRADEIVVVAKVDGERDGVAMFVVPRSSAVVEVVESIDPTVEITVVHLTGAEVPVDRRLEGSVDGTELVGDVAAFATTAAGLTVVAACERILDLTVGYVKERSQFGVAIGSFQAVKHRLVDVYLAIERARALAWYAVLACDEHTPDRHLAASMAKAAADDAAVLAVREGLQLHGAIGFTWGYGLHLHLRTAMTMTAVFGRGAAHRRAVAEALGILPAPCRLSGPAPLRADPRQVDHES